MEIGLAVLNLEEVTSHSVLPLVFDKLHHGKIPLVIFTNVTTEENFMKVLMKGMERKKYTADSFHPVESLVFRTILFRSAEHFEWPKLRPTFTNFGEAKNKSKFGYWDYEFPKVIIRTFFFDPEIDPFYRKSYINQMTVPRYAEADVKPMILVSDFRIMKWETTIDLPPDWYDLLDYQGSETEEDNFNQDRRDRIWFNGDLEPVSFTSISFLEQKEKLQGDKKMLIAYFSTK